MDREDELTHFGTKGMRWGVRKYQNSDGTLTSEGRARYLKNARKYDSKAGRIVPDNFVSKRRQARLVQKAKDARSEVRRSDLAKARTDKQAKAAEAKRKKTVKEMSNEELQAAVNRMNLEKQYSKLVAERNAKDHRVRNLVTKTLAKSGEKALSSLSDYAFNLMVGEIKKSVNKSINGKSSTSHSSSQTFTNVNSKKKKTSKSSTSSSTALIVR